VLISFYLSIILVIHTVYFVTRLVHRPQYLCFIVLPFNTMHPMSQIICLAGATGTGKTALALKLAHNLNTKILSCDSVQIFRELNIGSNKERENHLMVDVKHYGEKYDVEKYVNDSLNVIKNMEDCNRLVDCDGSVRVLVVGGCGLYMERLSSCCANVVKVFLFKNRRVLYRDLDRRCEEMVLNGLLEETLRVCVRNDQINGKAGAFNPCSYGDNVLRDNIVGCSLPCVDKSLSTVENDDKHGMDSYERKCCVENAEEDKVNDKVGNSGNGNEEHQTTTGMNETCFNVNNHVIRNDDIVSTRLLPIGYKESYNFLIAGDYSYNAFISFLNTFKKNTRNYVRRQETFFKRKNYVFINAERDDLMERIAGVIEGERVSDEYAFKYFKTLKQYKTENTYFKTEEDYEMFRKRCYYLQLERN
ncbi:tRNA delta(2)-isopentenylpyrophosphate transferase, partial [Trachipleistophora hominis]